MCCASCPTSLWPRRQFSSSRRKPRWKPFGASTIQSFNALRPFVFLSGGPFQGPNDVIVDDFFARSGQGYHVGDTIPILNHTFRICGIVEHGKGGRKFCRSGPWAPCWARKTMPPCSMSSRDNPENEAASSSRKSRRLRDSPNMKCKPCQEVLSMLTPEHLPGFNMRLRIVIGIAVGGRLSRHFSGDVHRGSRANPRNRHFEVVGSFPDLHRQSGLAGNRVSCPCRHCFWGLAAFLIEGRHGCSLSHPSVSRQSSIGSLTATLIAFGGALWWAQLSSSESCP